MRFDIATLALLLAVPAAASAHDHRSPFTHRAAHGSRRERLFRDVRTALSSLIASRKNVEESSSRGLEKRGQISGGGQCILHAQHALRPATTSATPTHPIFSTQTTPTMAGGPTSPGGGGSKATSTITSSSSSHKGSSTSTSTSTSASPTSSWIKKFDASGSDFFDSWDFFAAEDPTHGTVNYQTRQNAEANNLISMDSGGNAILRVETTPNVPGNRMSVRIESPETFTGGLWVLDASHMPVGCGAWPAFWTHGPNWPAGGEIDILEGVSNDVLNQMTLHTTPGCNITPDTGFSGTIVNNKLTCSSQEATTGCGIRNQDTRAYGAGFNANGGGVYTMLWDADGISVWFFPRGSIPSDISSQAPRPENWGAPSAHWAASGCDPFRFNQDHVTIINTTICGDWAGGAWAAPTNGGGPSCQQSTGYSTCQEYIQKNGAAFEDAYWRVKSVRIYQTS